MERSILEGNKLLAALPGEELETLGPHLELVSLRLKEILFEQDVPIEYVYFPISCVVSLVTTMEDGQIVEVGTVGKEGMVGLPVFLGAPTIPLDAFSQVPGDAMRMASKALRTEVRPGSGLHELLGRYTEAMLVFAAQSSACNRVHSVRQRAGRWLLHTHDHTGRDEFPLTQEFLAQMLSVRRASVNEVARAFQGEGLIRYSRGVITVLNRPSLEAAACECYSKIKAEFDRLPS
jgi:CRP-like cAMP-binding protein